MSGNFIHPTILNASCDIPVENAASFFEKEQFNKQVDSDKKLSFESDTDFQSFLLPLEQDFTKSSKGYASLLTSISNKVISDAHYKDNLKGSKINNMLFSENFDNTDYLRKTNDKLLYNNSLCSTHFTVGASNLYNERQKQLVHTLEIIENHQNNTENVFSGSHLEITINAFENSHQKNNISTNDENIKYVEKISKTSCDDEVTISDSNKLDDKSENNSELSETDSSDGCSNKINFCNDDSTKKHVTSPEKTSQRDNQCSVMEIESIFFKAVNFDSSDEEDDDEAEIEESKENSFVFFPEDSDIDSDSIDSLDSMVCERDASDLIIEFSSEGYVNECFEDDDFQFEESSFLKSINESWNDSMKDISDEPRTSKRVSFVSLSNLVSIHSYEPDDDDYCYSLYVLDQLRFQQRIRDFEPIIEPYLTLEHRASIYKRNG